MIRPERTRVLWVGGRLPRATAAAMARWGLSPSEGPPAAADALDRTLRAVVLRFDRRALASFRPLLTGLLPVTEGGALLAVVANRRDFAAASKIAGYVERLAAPEQRRARVLADAPDQVCRACAYHDPGPPANPALALEGDVDPIDPADAVLLRRAFGPDVRRVALRRQNGGRSAGTVVWRATAHTADGRCCEPFVVKAGRRPAIREEFQTTRDFVLDFVPFPFRPPFAQGHLVLGGTRGLLVSAFVDRAQRFDDYVVAVRNPQVAVAALFDGALRNLRRDARRDTLSVGRLYVEREQRATQYRAEDERMGRPYRSVLPDPRRLVVAQQVARALGHEDIPPPDELWRMLRATPDLPRLAQCRCHGDLNARNLFVRWNGVDVILIDFSHAGEFGPLSQDPARLEVSLAWDVRDERGYLPDEVLRRLYQSPLLPPGGQWPDDGRTEAVRQLRLQAGGEGVTNAEYEISVACHLLRHARSGAGDDTAGPRAEAWRLKGLAYALAAELIEGRLVAGASAP